MQKWSIFIVLMLLITRHFSQGSDCNTLGPICTNNGLSFTAQTGVTDAMTTNPGNNYGCLGTAPNPSWYYLEISSAGDVEMELSAASDVDFALWGPFPNLAAAQAGCGSYGATVPDMNCTTQYVLGIPIGTTCDNVGCSFDFSATENPGIENAQVGEVYVMLITNYANTVQTISLTQTGGTGATDCSIVTNSCSMTSLTAALTNCYNTPTLGYDIGGVVTYSNPPTTGQLIVEDCFGTQQTFNAPFGTSTNYTLTGLVQDGAPCTITAYFTADPLCTITQPVQAPSPILTFSANCTTGNGDLDGVITYSNPPTTGSLIIEVTDGTTTVQDVIAMPAASPQNWNVNGLDPAIAPYNITYYFDNNPTCTQTLAFNCGCTTNAGLDANECSLGYTLGATPSAGTGTWSSTVAGVVFTNVNSPTSGVTVPAAGSYVFTWTDDNGAGCITTDDVTIQFSDIQYTEVLTNPTCGLSDGVINLTGANGITNYTYSIDGGTTSQASGVFNGLASGTYNVVVTDNISCTASGTLALLSVGTATINSVTETDELCATSCDGILTINATLATQYSVDNGVTFSPNNTFNNLCSGVYDIVVQDAAGCATVGTATIASPSPVTLAYSNDTSICIGGTASLSVVAAGGVGSYTYAWSNGGGSVTSQNVSPLANTSYCVGVQDANGCTPAMLDCIDVSLNPALSVVVLSDQTICEGDAASISASASGGDGGGYTYSWNQGVGLGDSQSVSPITTTMYTVTVSDGCETPPINASVTITVNSVPAFSFSADHLDGCSPVVANFTELGVPVGATCLWTFESGGTNSACSGVTHNFVQPGCWDVTLQITTTDGCVASVTNTDMICVFDYPNVDFEFQPQPTTVLHPEVFFTNLTTGATAYAWAFDTAGDSVLSIEENPSYFFPSDSGTYHVCLEALSSQGCPGSICYDVQIVEELLVFVPNAFTPDGKNGNDTFYPVLTGVQMTNYRFMVFNRWGQLLFETSEPHNGWNGSYKGIPVEQDTYVWKLNLKDELGDKHTYTGHITLLR